MRIPPSRYSQPAEIKVKKGQISRIAHLSVPLHGLSLDVKMTTRDPMLAPILTNFTVEDDRILSRSGYRKLSKAGDNPIERLVPYYGSNAAIMAATGGALHKAADGALVRGGFQSNDWSWTTFSNLGDKEYTVMVNGIDGVWSWDGGYSTPASVNITKISHTNPTEITVNPADFSLFSNGMTVVIAGADAAHSAANGSHAITSVGTPVNGFKLVAVDTSSAATDQTTGATVAPAGSLVKEAVTKPSSAPWMSTDQFHLVVAHQNRLFFADPAHLAFYYLPLMQKSGEAKPYPLNAIFRRGGSIRAMASWTVDGGVGMDDHLVLFSSNGEAVIFSGTDPAEPEFWKLVGVYSFDAPLSKDAVVKYGGELYVLAASGLLPMSLLLKAETETLGKFDKTVMSLFMQSAFKHRSQGGWQAFMNPSSGRVYCNLPQGGKNRYWQMLRHMPKNVWSKWEGIPARCWGWIDPIVYFGDDDGNIYELHPQYLNDDGDPIKVDVQLAWTNLNWPGVKHFKMINTYLITEGDPEPYIDVKVDYDYSPPENQPQLSKSLQGAVWNLSPWADGIPPADTFWAASAGSRRVVNGVKGTGNTAGIRLQCLLDDCTLAITGFDVVYETGSFI